MHTNSCGKFFLAIGEPFKYYIAEFSVKEGWWGGAGGPPHSAEEKFSQKTGIFGPKCSF